MYLKKILLVDDDELMSEFTVMTLMSIGSFQVKYCNSGRCALDNVAEFMPDLILLDVMMAEMDGIETFNELKKNASMASFPIVFLTGKNTKEAIKKYTDMGAIGVISKPFNPQVLCATLLTLWNSQ